MRNLSTFALWQVQKIALEGATDTERNDAAHELARRYTAENVASDNMRQHSKVRGAWLDGWNSVDGKNPYVNSGNYSRPLRRAFSVAYRLRVPNAESTD